MWSQQVSPQVEVRRQHVGVSLERALRLVEAPVTGQFIGPLRTNSDKAVAGLFGSANCLQRERNQPVGNPHRCKDEVGPFEPSRIVHAQLLSFRIVAVTEHPFQLIIRLRD
jgi:hypothetical protein